MSNIPGETPASEQPEAQPSLGERLRAVQTSADSMRKAQESHQNAMSKLLESLWRLPADATVSLTFHGQNWRDYARMNLVWVTSHCQNPVVMEIQKDDTTTVAFTRGNLEFGARYDDAGQAHFRIYDPKEPDGFELPIVEGLDIDAN